jgi:hypothetical protein
MSLKPYSELIQIDVMPFCDQREVKDEDGKKVKVPYLNWAKCKQLLHENGAETVYFEPVINEKTGSTLFMTDIAFTDSNSKTNRCFEVRVKVVIDELEFIQNYPLMNGMYVVREDTINQLRLSNAQARAFVKGAAIRTGLGFQLWVKTDETDQHDGGENLYFHNIMKIKERIEQLLTVKMDGGLSKPDICKALKVREDQFDIYMKQYAILDYIEKEIQKL